MRYIALLSAALLLALGLNFALTRESEGFDPQEVTLPPPITALDDKEMWTEGGEVYVSTREERDSHRIEALIHLQGETPDLEPERRVRPDDIVQAFEALLPNLFVQSLYNKDINEEWLPSRESLAYWVQEHRLGQIADLDAEYLRKLFPADDDLTTEYESYLHFDGALSESLSWPQDFDIERMWNGASRGLFEEALRAKHYASLADDALWDRLAIVKAQFGDSPDEYPEEWAAFRDADEEYMGYQRLRGSMWANEEQWWLAMCRADEGAYAHWSFLWQVSSRHFK